MKTRSKDYGDPTPAPQRRTRKPRAKETYLVPNSAPIPQILKNSPCVRSRSLSIGDITQGLEDLTIKITRAPQPDPSGPSTSRRFLPTPLSVKPFSPPKSTFFPLPYPPNLPAVILPSPPTARDPTPAPSEAPEDYSSQKFQALMPAAVSGTCEHLADDGSNYAEWEYRITQLIEHTTRHRGYLSDPTIAAKDPIGNDVIFSMIELSVLANIGRRFSGSAFDAMKSIRALFFFPIRTAHLIAWQEALDFKLTDNTDVSGYFREIDKKILDLDRAGFQWTRDGFIGILYQLGVGSGFANVNQVLNARLKATPTFPMASREVEEAIRAEIATQRASGVQHLDTLRLTFPPPSALAPIAANSLASRNRPSPSSVSTPTRQFRSLANRRWSPPRHQRLAPSPSPRVSQRDLRNCLCCGRPGHWSRACPFNQPHQPPQRDSPAWPRPIPTSASQDRVHVNLVDFNGEVFSAEFDGPLPEGIWASEGNLNEAWEEHNEGSDSHLGSHENRQSARDSSGNASPAGR